ncbi:retrovirus-related pol polyprotein from transposon TNT 1-94 [Tanacetum coccineum]|uniref:Retrovirus-related pol polyprotein from transposon TNT 1-94 n=1 Tax=Tanacetum coccineum TaxID=301880 RepID=A0ABQ5GYU2_9ASTR
MKLSLSSIWISSDGKKDKKTFQRSRDDKNGKSDRKCFRCGDPNHLIGECPKPPKDKNQRAFIEGSWSDSGEEMMKRLKTKHILWLKHQMRSILGPRPKHIMVNNVKIPVASDNEICVGVDLEPDEWIKDSGYFKDMAGTESFSQPTRHTMEGNEKKNLENDIEDETLEIDEVVNIKESRNHPLENLDQEVVVEDNQILTREITDVMKTWVNIIREMSFVLVEIWIMSPCDCVICSFVLLRPHNTILLKIKDCENQRGDNSVKGKKIGSLCIKEYQSDGYQGIPTDLLRGLDEEDAIKINVNNESFCVHVTRVLMEVNTTAYEYHLNGVSWNVIVETLELNLKRPRYRIVKLSDDLLPIGIDLRNIFKRKVGNGKSKRFWLDNWVGGGPLNVSYNRLFRLEVNKNCLVRDRAPTVPQHHTVSFSDPSLSGVATTIPHTLGSIGLILPPGLHFQWTWSRPLRSLHEIDELNEIVSLLSNLHLSNSHDTW